MKFNVKTDCRGLDIRDVIPKIFKERKIEDPNHFMNPSIDDLLPLDSMTNSLKAAQIVINAIGNGYKIGILADTDLDGITSGAIIYRYLKNFLDSIEIYIDHGKQHGLLEDDLDKYKQCDLLIIVDSLNSDCLCYKKVKENSQIEDIIVLDHHAINSKIPYDEYITLVSSQRNYGNKELSGSGVVWKFCLLLDAINDTEYANELVDLAASGIVADMMDVTVPENRFIISKGLECIYNPAIKKLAGGFGWDSKSIAFSLAPVANASNRLDKNEDAIKSFITDDIKEVTKCIKVMKKCKDEQNAEISKLMPDIYKQCQEQINNKMIVVFIESDYGIAGLIGNKILPIYKRPILILKDNGDYYSGSMRAVGVDDFRNMLNESKLAVSFGHELAAGVEIKKENLGDLINYMDFQLPDVSTFEEKLDADIAVDIDDIDREYIERIKELNKISGTGFKPIKIYMDGISRFDVSEMSGGKHLVIYPDNSDLVLIKWNFDGDREELEDAALMGDELECVGELNCGFIGRTFMLQVILDYIGIKQ